MTDHGGYWLMDRNGYFTVINKEDGTYIRCVAPINKGAPIDVNDVTYYLDKKLIRDYDAKSIRNYLVAGDYKEDFKVSPEPGYRQNEHLKLTIDKSGLKVIGRFYPPTNEGEQMSKDEIIGELKHNNVVFGYVMKNIDIFVKARLYCTDILLAKAEPPVHGHDAKIEYFFKTETVGKPKLNEDGSVDFHDLDNISHVNKGDKLAHLTPADMGKPGTNVFGKPLPAKKVNRMVLKHGINISVSEDGLDMFSDVSGHATLVGNTVHVSNVYEVPANVDTSTGDIEYSGNVMVKGNVITGFSVKASGDIIINGVVEGANLEAGGDIVIGLGVQGIFKAKLKAGGNIVSKFFENCEDVYAEGNITTDAVMHSNVKAKGEVTVQGRRGLITGGTVISSKKIHAKTVGSTMGTATLLEIGLDPERMDLYHKIEKDNEMKQEEIEDLKQMMSSYQKRIMNREKLEPDQMKRLQEASIRIKQLSQDINENKKITAEVLEELEVCKKGKIFVAGDTYAGVTIIIANTKKKITDEAIHTCFVKEGADIRLSSF
jgi:hypothetical protein